MASSNAPAPRKAPTGIELQGHYRLADKPERTLETLKVFFPRHADAYYAELRAGRSVRVDGAKAVALAGPLAAQGFQVTLLR